MLLIFDDPLREPLKENFTIALSPLESSLSSQFTNLTVDETPSYVVILDNDSTYNIVSRHCDFVMICVIL